MRYAVLLLFMVCACTRVEQSTPSSAMPSDQDREVALEIAWDGVLGMSTDKRPVVSWVKGCTPDDPVAPLPSACFDLTLKPDGQLTLSWRDVWGHDTVAPRISTTEFAMGLYYWKYRLDTGRWHPGAPESAMAPMQQALIAAGL